MNNKLKSFMGGAWLLVLTISVGNAQVAAVADATIKGTPYINETFEQGVIFYANNNVKVPVRYNGFKDMIEYQQNGRTLELEPAASIKKIKLDNTTFVVDKYEDNGKSKLGYFALLDSGKVTLYARKAISYLPPKKGAALDGTDRPGEFKKVPDSFYFKIGNNRLEEVKSIKSMIAAFGDKQEELTAFAKKEKISPRKADELIQLVKYYNSLE
jgi:hypothetical protein